MKKSLVITLTLVFLVGIAGAFAAANPFVDVPPRHWSYDAVAKLVQDGIVTGYDDKTFKGNQALTRYEMAIVVAKAMGKAEKADASNKELIDKLAVEYAKELNSLGVRVDNLEKKVDKFDINGKARIRYDNQKAEDTAIKTPSINLDVFYSYKVNNDWFVKGESEWNRNFKTPQKNQDETSNAQFEQLYITGPIAGTTIKAGKYSYFSNYGLLFDDKISGGAVNFGKSVQVGLNYGYSDQDKGSDANNKVTAIDVKWAVNKDWNIVADWEKVTNKSSLGNQYGTAGINNTVKYYDIGFDTKIGSDFALQAMYAKSDADVPNNKAQYVQVTYKAADSNKVGSYDIFAAYRKIPGAAYSAVYPTGDYVLNFKGYRFGFDYVPMQNTKFTTWYQDGKFIDTVGAETAGQKVKTYRAQMEFYF